MRRLVNPNQEIAGGGPSATNDPIPYAEIYGIETMRLQAQRELAIARASDPLLLTFVNGLEAATAGIVTYLDYEVPSGSIAVIDGIGVELSRAYLWGQEMFAWRITRSGGEVQTMQVVSPTTTDSWNKSPMGTIRRQEDVEPIYFRSGTRIGFQGETLKGFDNWVTLSVRLKGRLLRAAIPRGANL